MEYTKLLVQKEETIKKALKIIDKSEMKIVFVVEGKQLVGSLTDGDIRRYLLAGGQITDSVLVACNKNPKVANDSEKARKILDAEFRAVPIIDSNNNIIDICVYKKEAIRKRKIRIPVVINAGGKGTRLEPFTKVLPKPLIPVGDLPIIEHIMLKFSEYGCNEFYSIVNYKKELIKTYFNEINNKYNIKFLDEKNALGTAGGLSLLKGKFKNTFFFINCDTLILSDYEDLFKYHKKNKSDITIVCAEKNISVPFGVVEKNDDNTIKELKEKPEFSFLTIVGLYVFEPDVLKDIKKNERIDMPDLIEREIEKGKKVSVYSINENSWLDMGQLPELEKMRERIYGE